MTTQKKQSFSSTGLVLLAILFLALTILNNVLFRGVQLDLTENKLYTISDGTRNILADIDEPLQLYFFFSSKATEGVPYLRDYSNRVRDLLRKLTLVADGNIRLTEIDPVPFSEEEDRAAQFGLQAVSLGGTWDPIYFGLAGTNAVDDLEVISFFQPDREAFLEYDLAKLIYTLSRAERTVVGLMSSLPMARGFDPATRQPTQPWVVTTQLEQLFEVRSLATEATSIDEDIDLLVVVHPKLLGDATLYAIDQFVMRGGKLMVFVDPLSDAELPRDPAGASSALFSDRSSNLDTLFAAWGVAFDVSEVVLDPRLALTVNAAPGQPPVRHLAMLGADSETISVDDVITADLDRLNFGSVGHLALADGSALEITPLVSSSGEAGLITAEQLRFLPDPDTLRDDFSPTGETYVLAARLRGPLDSAFPSGPPLRDGDEQTDEPAAEHLAATDGAANIVVVADTDFLTDRMWVQSRSFFGQRVFTAFADNGSMVINALDNLTGSSDLIAVRSRGTYSRPFERVEALRREAELRYRAEEQALQNELEETERRLQELQSAKDQDNLLIISPEQQAELLRFQDQKISIRQALRDVQRNLDKSIEDLGDRLRIINIGLVPLLLSVAAGLIALVRVRRRARR
jgi:ABC-type uncharacterized transport system involved in gliding motility auxiliary subunit